MINMWMSFQVVELQDLSLMFDTSFSEVVSTIQHLEKGGQLTGVLDDRGKVWLCVLLFPGC